MQLAHSDATQPLDESDRMVQTRVQPKPSYQVLESCSFYGVLVLCWARPFERRRIRAADRNVNDVLQLLFHRPRSRGEESARRIETIIFTQ